jgi:hypothetical protein
VKTGKEREQRRTGSISASSHERLSRVASLRAVGVERVDGPPVGTKKSVFGKERK